MNNNSRKDFPPKYCAYNGYQCAYQITEGIAVFQKFGESRCRLRKYRRRQGEGKENYVSGAIKIFKRGHEHVVDVLEYLTCLLSPRITNSSRSGNIPINVFTSVDYDNAVGKVTIHDRQTYIPQKKSPTF